MANGDAVAGDGSGDAPGRLELLALVRARGHERRDTPFLLASGAWSHDYVDLRRALARGPDLRLAAEVVAAQLARQGAVFDAIGGMTMGADPLAHAVALLAGCEWFSVRKAEKRHGLGRRLEGAPLGPGYRVVVVEDTTTTGASLMEAVDEVLATGAVVTAACTILDRGDAAARELARRGIPYHALLTYRDLGIPPVVPPVASAEAEAPHDDGAPGLARGEA
jgi:orotate phosphoribosyltransferase